MHLKYNLTWAFRRVEAYQESLGRASMSVYKYLGLSYQDLAVFLASGDYRWETYKATVKMIERTYVYMEQQGKIYPQWYTPVEERARNQYKYLSEVHYRAIDAGVRSPYA